MNIGYARVSTQDQNLALQIDALQQQGCETIYQEKMTGTKTSRPELENCLKSLRKGDTLIVWKLDRLGRSLKDLLTIVNQLQERGVAFRSIKDNIETTSSTGRLIFHLFAALAEFEADIIRERTHAGLAASRARGRKGGRNEKLTVKDVAKAKAMLLDPDMTKTEVAAHFGITRKTLDRYLHK